MDDGGRLRFDSGDPNEEPGPEEGESGFEPTLLPEDNTEIAVVPSKQRDVWLTEEQKRQPAPPTSAGIEAAIRHRDQRRREAAEPRTEADENADLLRRLDAWQEGTNAGPLIRWAAAHLRGESSRSGASRGEAPPAPEAAFRELTRDEQADLIRRAQARGFLFDRFVGSVPVFKRQPQVAAPQIVED